MKYKKVVFLLVFVILLSFIISLGSGEMVQKFKQHIDFFNEIRSYNDNIYSCPETVTLLKTQEKLNKIDVSIRGNLNAQDVLNKCKKDKFFSIPAKPLNQNIQQCLENLRTQFKSNNIQKLAYNNETLIAECLIQEDYEKNSLGKNIKEDINLRNSGVINKVKQDYYTCANVPVEEGVNFSCSDYLIQVEKDAAGVSSYDT
ncbi:MAG: hypothetical protein AABX04_06795 [Nanoarchaeota archaeon]